MLDLGRTFLQSVERSPGAVALVDDASRFTYAEWFERIRRVAGGLAGMNLGRGDHLLVVLQNRCLNQPAQVSVFSEQFR